MPVIFRTGGGGSALNFKVKAYSELPETGSENEIAVITNTPITGYVLQAEEPTKSGTAGDTLTWDGNADGLEAVGTFVKVSSCTLTVADFANGCSVSLSDGTVLTCTKADIEEMGGIIAISSLACYIPVDGFDAGEENPVSKGLYFNTEEREGVYVASITINGYDGFPASIADGQVWVRTSDSSSVAFYLDKKNQVKTYPVGVSQYIGGNWEKKDSYAWKGEWVAFGSVYLYNHGDECIDITGGWIEHKKFVGGWEKDATQIELWSGYTTDGGGYCNIRTQNMIDLTDVKTIKVNCGDISARRALGVTQKTSDYFNAAARGNYFTSGSYVTCVSTDPAVMELDVSSLSGSYYVVIAACQTDSIEPRTFNFDEVEMV